ncbi:MAG: SgcJ/EcaC family oxidoreductase [Rhodospirillales bacterium]|nr:SgcJ/EcaC family oxidoreductase [Rhodospirillales bacterium]
MKRRVLAALPAGCWLAAVTVSPAAAQSDAVAEKAIRDALSRWTADFNARDSTRICDLFAPDLRYDFRGSPERDYNAMCNLLRQALSDRSRKFTYSFDIKEIIVSGDIAIVRLVWTSRVTQEGSSQAAETKEPGLDVFRLQPDGKWRIAHYMAYEAP